MEDIKLALFRSCQNNNLQVARQLLEQNPSLLNQPLTNSYKTTALMAACSGGALDVADFLLSLNGIDLERRDIVSFLG